MFKGVKSWWSGVDKYDKEMVGSMSRAAGFIVAALVVVFGMGQMGFLLFGGDSGETVTAPVIPLTVVETTTRMEGDSAAAVATRPDGVKVLLYGNWVEGQQVDAYEYDGPNGTQAVYADEPPTTGGNGEMGALLGVIAGIALYVGMIFAFLELKGRRKAHRERSKSIVSAALL